MIPGKKINKTYIYLGAVLISLGFIGIFLPNIYELFVDDTFESAEAKLPTFEEQFIGDGEDVLTTPVLIGGDIPASKGSGDRLLIVDVNINMPVFLGETEKTLNKGGWLFPTTSRPELGGNSVIFGHRYMYRPPKSNTFWNLDKVEIGDEMILTWRSKEYKYKVFEIKIVEPTDLSVIRQTSDARLTVITCTPLFSTKQRLVVIGKLIK
ncbi:MAG: hypothetical protein A3B91_02115 [Candidatus Yanofskybacteria bacterium RIFCSPHIGHO2_02_FULL_41_29]|uniref:Sortase n=1 Tax=Candidatus Yanofskybacteria bacterium RIFCSPHIGHO2_01_FULL_41_53 TaxID=1802663 RepID=A0A1F8EHF6_9BACT|nr:MAG: hypothetical protein A2650_05010 [Candidatus Yanofskybacteria bacterium RIFCSPHIGHO2_01_FULL_41_53]OGN12321.1 MAG: hypothetical protein A3B91_02115 [Candidatus Yanofskybacteria bacterium RIFCSPHIGHO2_02_FULL_41_29]OGN17720.1 MAG: hypothetical protein A3F48_00580 [Candidatus Yanofskybacteria bacterium RIFCSPHIGHO2_12_FULL_41_9]OGN22026.1 MAG: hypothetical protein A2916_04350 [Candidatus Yanofskybacteria bacterium RIFCSPLOWO2_01_FULL_41_67]OGN28916.1 MAG: hypothetical protein A3H54_02110 